MTSALFAVCLVFTADSTRGHHVQDPRKSICLDHRLVGGRYTTILDVVVDQDVPNYIDEILLAIRDNDYDYTFPALNIRR